jgi:DNA invertase Pin-like site-specific DNA recombinase
MADRAEVAPNRQGTAAADPLHVVTARELISAWEPRLKATRDGWADTLPTEAATEWRRGGAYVRESSVNSLHGAAPDVQLRGVLAQMEQKKIYVPEDCVFFDVESGTEVGPRAAFQRLFEACLRGGIDAIGVYVSERLFRNLEQALSFKRQFRMHGIELVYLGRWEGDGRNPAAWQLEVMQDASAEVHARNTSYYVGLHFETVSRAGRPVGRIPEVYEAKEWEPSFSGRRGSIRRWEASEPLASIMKEAMRRYLDGATFSAIAAWSATTELKGLTPRGRIMDAGWWRDTLGNPKFAGYQVPSTYTGFKPGRESPRRPVRNSKSELVPSMLPALWSLEDYHAMHRMANERWRGPKTRKRYRSYLLSGIAYDPDCGHSMRVWNHHKDHYWLRCMMRQVGASHSRAVRADIAERELDELIGRIVWDDQDLTRQIEQELIELARAAQSERQAFRANPAIGAVRQALATLTQAGIGEGRVDLERRLEQLEAADEQRRQELDAPLVEFRRALEQLANWRVVWDGADTDTKNRLLRAAGVRVVVGRIPNQKPRTPGHLLSVSSENRAFALALGVAMQRGATLSESGHKDVAGTANDHMPPITLTVGEPWHEYAARFLPRSEAGDEAALTRPLVTEAPRWHTQPPAMPGGPWLTQKEFARRVGRSTTTVRTWQAAGRVQGVTAYQGKTAWTLVHEREVERMKRELARTPSERLERPAGGPWLTASETASELGLTRYTVYKHISSGIIPAIMFHSGGRERWFVSAADVAFIRSTPGRVRPPPGPGGEWLTVAEFARRVGLTPTAVLYRIKRGHHRAYRFIEGHNTSLWLIPEAELERGRRLRAPAGAANRDLPRAA